MNTKVSDSDIQHQLTGAELIFIGLILQFTFNKRVGGGSGVVADWNQFCHWAAAVQNCRRCRSLSLALPLVRTAGSVTNRHQPSHPSQVLVTHLSWWSVLLLISGRPV